MQPEVAAPTINAACLDVHGEWTSREPSACLQRQLENQPRRGACTLWRSLLPALRVEVYIGGRNVDCRERQVVVFNLSDFNPWHLSRVQDRLIEQRRRTLTIGNDVEPETIGSVLRDTLFV